MDRSESVGRGRALGLVVAVGLACAGPAGAAQHTWQDRPWFVFRDRQGPTFFPDARWRTPRRRPGDAYRVADLGDPPEPNVFHRGMFADPGFREFLGAIAGALAGPLR